MATQAMDPRRLRLLQQRLFAYDMPGGIPSVPYHLREKCSGAWLYGQALDPEGLYAIDDLHQGTPRPVQPGRCVNFDGVDDYIDCGDIADIGTGDLTVSLWFNTSGTGVRAIITKNDMQAETVGRWGLYIQASTGKAYVFVDTAAISDIVVYSPASVCDGTWKMLTGVIDRTAGLLRLYINGAQVATGSLATLPAGSLTNSTAVRIGRDGTGNYGGSAAKMFDARIYNLALTDSEISQIYNTSKPGGRPGLALYPSNLVGHWKLDDVNLKFVRDSSGNAYHGTWNGFTLGSNGHWTAMHTGVDVPFSWANEVGYGLKTSANVLTQGQFPAGQTEWSASAQSSISTGFATIKSTDGSHQLVGTVGSPLYAGRRYRVSYSVIANRGGSLASDSFGGIATGSTVGRHTFTATAAYGSAYDTPTAFSLKRSGGACDIDVTDIVIEELDEIPQKSSVPSTDVLGNTLTYTGECPRNAKLIDSFCGTFDGVDDRATATDASDVTRFNNGVDDLPFSVAFLANFTTGALRCAVSRGGTATNQFEWGVLITQTGAVTVGLYSTVGDSMLGVITVAAPFASGWHHCVFTYDGSKTNAGMKVYVDGVLSPVTSVNNSGSGAYSGMNYNGNTLHVGQFPDASYRFPGALVDVRVYGSALSAADILLLYQGKTISASPVAHYPLQEGNGAILYDASGNGLHATLAGATLATFWGTRQSQVHRNIRRGFRDADNLVPYSQDLSNAAWFKSNVAVVADAIIDPQGNLTADKATFSTATAFATPAVTFVNGQQYTLSVWVKCATGTIDFRLGTLTAGTVAVAVSPTKVATTSWQRFEFTFTAGATDARVNIQRITTSTDDELHIWGMQLVRGASARNYTPTTATTFDRVRIPIKSSGIGAADGNAITNPAGQWHNNAETKLNFAPVAAPWTEGQSAPAAYAYGDTLPANGFKEVVTVGTVPREQGFYLTKV